MVDQANQNTDSTQSPTALTDDTAAIAANPEVQDAFEKVFGPSGDGSPRRGPTAKERQLQQQADDELPTGDQDDTGDTDKPEPTDQTSDQTDDQDTDTTDDGDDVTLDPVLMHAAKRAGMTDEEINDFWKESPEVAERTFGRLYEQYNDLTDRYARLGQVNANDVLPAGPQHTATSPPPRPELTQNNNQPDVLEEIYGQDQLAAFQQNYGENFSKDILTPMLKHMENQIAPVRNYYQEQQQLQMAQQVDQFFTGLDKSFQKLYGNGESVSALQHNNRVEMCNLADNIMRGASVSGVSMTVQEAMERANSHFAMPHVQELERQRITQQVRSRSKQVTHRPQQRRGGKADAPPPKSDDAAIDAVTKMMQEKGILT